MLPLEVSMLVTKENLDQPIIGFNVIEEVMKYCDPLQPEALVEKEVLFDSFAASFQNVKVNKIDTLIELIHNKKPDKLCTVRTVKRDIVIPKNQSVKVNCRVNTGPLSKRTSVLFQPDETELWPEGLELNETLLTLKRGPSSQIGIEVSNTTGHDIKLRNRTVSGSLQMVRSVTPVEVQLRPTSKETVTENNTSTESDDTKTVTSEISSVDEKGKETSSDSKISENKVPNVTLGDNLSEEQKILVRKMFAEESDSFASDDDDIGYAPELELEIQLSNQKPVQKNYISVPRPLYPEIKQYVEDLLNRGFITESKSSYSSPVVCVCKKDGGMKLCIDYRELNKRSVADRHPILKI